MSLWRQLTSGLRSLIHPKSVDQEVADEIRDYLEKTTAALVDKGVSLEDARRRARSELGDATLVRQQVRSRGWENIFAPLLADLRFAIRQLRLTPTFAFMSAVILAFSIGGCTAIFSAVYAILLKPLPYSDGRQIMMIWEDYSNQHSIAVAYGTFQGLRHQNRTFESMAALKPWQPVLLQAGLMERLEGQQVSASYFHVLAAVPLLGRQFVPADDEPNAPKVVILNEQLWRTHLAASQAIIGKLLMLDGVPYTVIGVMPRSFENVLAPSARVWTPLRYDPALPSDGKEWGHHLRVVGRLNAGVSKSQAAHDLNQIFRELRQQYAEGYASSGGPSSGITLDALQQDISLQARPALLAICSAALLLILLACVNVTNSLLMHGIQRRNGLSMRTAPNADPYRAVRQVFLESFILAAFGGFLGVAMAQSGIQGLAMIIPPGLPRANGISLNHETFLFLIGITGLLGILLGIVPGLAIYRRHRDGKEHPKVAEPIRATRLNHGPFIAVQVALTFTLLVGTGLLLRSRQVLSRVNPGFQAPNLLTMQVQDSTQTQNNARANCELFKRTLAAIRQVPGVVSAGLTSQLPLSGKREVYGIQFEKEANVVGDAAFRYTVMPGYIETMGISLKQGRLFSGRDLSADAQKVVIINESFATREFAGRDPIGQHVRVGLDVGHADRPWTTIVGVVSDVKQESLSETEEDAFYVPASQWVWADKSPWLVIRTVSDARSFAPAIRTAISSTNPHLTINRVDTMDHLVAASKDEQRFVLILFGSFGAMGIVLLAFGIYDVLSSRATLQQLILIPCGLLLATSVSAQQAASIDIGKAEAAFAEAKALSDGDGGRLWGQRLYGPMLFVLPLTHEVVANEADPAGTLHAQGSVYVGTLPKEMILANTAVEWEGERWTMVLWPLPEYQVPRDRLLMHELFHRIQPSLGLELASPENPQLDSLQGRLWLQLEWRALALAVMEKGQPQRQAIADALAFRAQRFSLYPSASNSERALEMNEGLAEYTGIRTSSPDLESARWRVMQRLTSPDNNTFVRSFAYTSGPAYGLLLDRFSPSWRVGLKAGADPASMLQKNTAIQPSTGVEQRAVLYGMSALAASEKERSAIAEVGRARYTALLIDGPTLELGNAGKFSFGFNPNELVPLGKAGTVYPSMQASDVWGTLEIEGGALLSSDFKKVTVPVPITTEGSTLKGPGWTLKLAAGWHATPDTAKPGSFTVVRQPSPQ